MRVKALNDLLARKYEEPTEEEEKDALQPIDVRIFNFLSFLF